MFPLLLQKYIFNSLRFSIDVHTLNAGPDSQARLLITQAISRQIAEFVQTERNIQPKDAKPRMTMAELYNKYIVGSDISGIVANQPDQVESIVGIDLTTQPSASQSTLSQAGPSTSNELSNAADKVKPMTKILEVNVHNRLATTSGQSLLRPRKQWAKPTNGIPTMTSKTNSPAAEKPTASIQMSRLKLTAALSKAVNGPTATTTDPSATNDDELAGLDDLSGSADSSSQSELLEPPSKRRRNSTDNGDMSPRPPSSTSISSNGSISSAETVAALASEAINSVSSIQELSQEHFLHCFRLCTPEHKAILLAKKPPRRRRNCTSEEARQLYKEKYALFERQYSVRRNKKEFMYSPPATRGRRRVVSNDKSVAKPAATKPAAAKPAASKKKRKSKAKRTLNGNRRSKTTSESSDSSNPSNASNSTNTSSSSTNVTANNVVPVTVPIVAAAITATAITAATTATAKAVIVQAKENKVCLKCYKRSE